MIGRLVSRLTSKKEKPLEPTGVVHDYTKRYWGHDYTIMEVFDGGQRLKAAGWLRGINRGDYLLLQDGKIRSTRYLVAEISYKTDPSDMWFASLTFAPRTREVPE